MIIGRVRQLADQDLHHPAPQDLVTIVVMWT